MSQSLSVQQLLEVGVHFGHIKKKWNPKMLPYIYTEKKGIHIIDLNKTVKQLEKAAGFFEKLASEGKNILFVATKKHAKQVVSECAQRAKMPYVTERWLGGMITNNKTIKESIHKIDIIEKRLSDGTLDNITKKEKLQLQRSKDKMERILGGIKGFSAQPHALFLIDIGFEHLALSEAKKKGITTVGLVDTNCDPGSVDLAIAGNDDSAKAIAVIVNYLTDAIVAGRKKHEEKKTLIKEVDKEDAPKKEAEA